MGVLYLVRHGQAPAHAYGPDGEQGGTDDGHGLTDLGLEQARRTGRQLARQVPAFTAAVSGDLARQRATLGAVLEAFDAPPEPIVDDGWNEYSVNSLPAAPAPEQLSSQAGYQDLLDASLDRWIAGATADRSAETYPEYVQRTTDAADRVRELAGTGQTVLVVSSAGTITALIARLWGVPPQRWPGLARTMVNASVSKVIVGRRGMTVTSVNEYAHLALTGDDIATFR